MITRLFFTDIDGTFINSKYNSGNNFENVKELAANQWTPVFVSSRTFSELKFFCKSGKIKACMIGENGGFVYIPEILKKKLGITAVEKLIETGIDRTAFEKFFFELSKRFGYCLQPIDLMNKIEYSKIAGYTVKDAERSLSRKYSYLFKFSGVKKDFEKISGIVKMNNLNLQFGGKWLSLSAKISKGIAAQTLKNLCGTCVSFGIGNSDNDYELLENVDFPFAIINENKKFCDKLLKLKNIKLIKTPAPLGWRIFKKAVMDYPAIFLKEKKL